MARPPFVHDSAKPGYLEKPASEDPEASELGLRGAAFLASAPLVDGELRLEFEKFGEHRLKVPAFHFRMMRTDTGEQAGRINLRVTWNEDLLFYAGHAGYGVDELHRGRRFTARSMRLLIPLAQALWITCNPENAPSRRSCELAGAKFVDIIQVPEDTDTYREGMRRKCRFRLDLGEAVVRLGADAQERSGE